MSRRRPKPQPKDYSHLCSWIDDPRAVEMLMNKLPFPMFADVRAPIQDTGKGKVMLLHKIVEKVAGYFPNRRQTIGDCTNPTAMVRMADGSQKPIAQVEIGDFVVTPQGNIREVIDLIEKPFDKKMVQIEVAGYHKPITLTPDHLCMTLPNVKRGAKGDKNETAWTPAVELNPGDKFLIPKTPSYLEKTYDLSEFSECFTEESDYKSLRTKMVSEGKVRAKKSSTEVNRFVPLDEKLGWLIGLYAAEGSYDNCRITFNLSSEEGVIAEKAKRYVWDVFGVEAKIRTVPSKPSVLYVRIANKIVAEFMHHLCRGNTYTKALHQDLLVCTENVKLEIVSGWMAGDGWKDKVGVSVSEDLVCNMFDLCNSIGVGASIVKRKACKKSKEAYDLKVSSVATLNSVSLGLKIKSRGMVALGKAATVKSVKMVDPESNFVYCIGVEGDHAFVADGFAIHNCVSQGAAYAVDCIKAVDIYIKKDFERWVDLTATEDIYWGSRNVIGKGRLGNGDGSLGVWAAKYVNEYGSLPRGKYGTVDLSTYSGSRAKTWGRAGYKLPKEFVDKIKEHPVEVVSQVKSYEEVRDLVVNGYAVTIASNQGFASRRDAEGFAKPQGSWAHQMCIIGVDDKHRRPGVLVQNSWGTWNGGPKRHDQPDGSFWVDADEIERRVLRSGDCWAFSGYAGFKPQKLNTRII